MNRILSKVPVPDTVVPMKRNKLTLKKNTATNAIKASCNPPKEYI